MGWRLTWSVGYSTLFDNTDGIHPTRGQPVSISPGFRGPRRRRSLPSYDRFRNKYMGFGAGWVFSVHGEAGLIKAMQRIARIGA